MLTLEINKNLFQMILKKQSFQATCTLLCSYHCKHKQRRNEPTDDIHKYLFYCNFYRQVTSAVSQRSLNRGLHEGSWDFVFIRHYSTGSFSVQLVKANNIRNIICILSNPLFTSLTRFRREYFKCNAEMVIKTCKSVSKITGRSICCSCLVIFIQSVHFCYRLNTLNVSLCRFCRQL